MKPRRKHERRDWRGPSVDYNKPVVIRYVCERCGVERAANVPLREVVHQDYQAPKLCPLCA